MESNRELFADVEKFSTLTFSIFRELVELEKADLAKRYEDGRTENLSVLDKVKELISYAKEKGWKSQETIWNAAGFITLLSLDLKTLMEDMVFNLNNEWKANLTIRNICIVLYEACQDIPTVLGKNFYNELLKYQLPKESLEDLFARKAAIKDFSTRYSDDLQTIRILVAAHRDHKFLSQVEVIDQLDVSKFLQITMEFEKLLNALGRSHQSILKLTADLFVSNKGIYDK